MSTHRLWVVRIRAEWPRYILGAAGVLGLFASARLAISPGVALTRTISIQGESSSDRGAEAFATLFVRRYLTWDAAEPQASARSLEQYFGTGFEPGGGLELPASGADHVQWAEVVQADRSSPRTPVYTVAAQTTGAGLLYLAVRIDRSPAGRLGIGGYPAFVGPPSHGVLPPPVRERPVDDPALVTVTQRALSNYLSRSTGELAADLTPDARVSPPSIPLRLETMQRPSWEAAGLLSATVQARDERGVGYTLGYRLHVAKSQGRWEVSEVQTNPNT